jgi:hypothetical protein
LTNFFEPDGRSFAVAKYISFQSVSANSGNSAREGSASTSFQLPTIAHFIRVGIDTAPMVRFHRLEGRKGSLA